MRTVAGLLAGAVAGTVSGAAAVLVHPSWWWLALGLLTGLATLRWLRGAWRVGFALGWGAAVVRGSLTRPEGDYLVSADPQGWTLLAGSLVLVVGALVSAAVGQGRPHDPHVRGTPS